MLPCKCFYCKDGKEHPNRKYHQEYRRITSMLLKAESLDPKDSISLEACVTCSHTRMVEEGKY